MYFLIGAFPCNLVCFAYWKASVYDKVCGSDGEESTCNLGDLGLSPVLERSPREGIGYHSNILGLPW